MQRRNHDACYLRNVSDCGKINRLVVLGIVVEVAPQCALVTVLHHYVKIPAVLPCSLIPAAR